MLTIFVVTAYFVLPLLWTHFENQPALGGVTMRTETRQKIPGDPLNIGLVGSKDEINAAFQRIGWASADPLSISNDMKIADSVVLDRSYVTAPVSTLMYQGRAQDLAFETPVGISADQRHHVRLWKIQEVSSGSRPLWLGAASFDIGVGISHYTGQITHHIDANLDRERDFLIKLLIDARIVSKLYQVTGIGATLNGRNGNGDHFFTDGELTVAELSQHSIPSTSVPDKVENPPLVRLKQSIWSTFAPTSAPY